MDPVAQLTETALERALAITQQPMGNLQLIDWQFGHLEIAAQRGFGPQFLERFRIVKMTDGCACGRAFRLRESVVIEDVADDMAFLSLRESAQEAGFRSVQSTPLISHSGAFIGVISTHGSHGPNSRQLEEIKGLARETADELIWLRSRVGTLATAREAIARAKELLKHPKPDTFLGKQHQTFFSRAD